MKKLPIGYYAVKSVYEENTGVFEYKGVKYSVTEGENVFPSLALAVNTAKEIPDCVIDGLTSYTSFSTPVILMDKGTHSLSKDAYRNTAPTFERSLTILGECACESPSVDMSDSVDAPAPNPVREGRETLLSGSFWWGRLMISKPGIDSFTVDGFSFFRICLEDSRTDEDISTSFAFRNIVYRSPMCRTLFKISPAKKDSKLHRTLELTNIRITGMDDLDYGYYFYSSAVDRVDIKGMVVDGMMGIFGFSDIIRRASSIPKNAQSGSITVRDSYFRGLTGENCISFSCPDIGDRSFSLTFENTVFSDASVKDRPVFNPTIHTSAISVSLINSKFVDTRGNSSSAISVLGVNNLTVKDCTFEGFSKIMSVSDFEKCAPPKELYNEDKRWITDTEDPHTVIPSNELDMSILDEIYKDRAPYYGDLHAHTACGGTSDGSYPMKDWPQAMNDVDLDFAAIVDHRQMRGFFLPEWDTERFIIGSEPGTNITNLKGCRHNQSGMHYNMLFPHKYGLAMVFANFPEFNFRGDELSGSYVYPSFTKERFMELCSYILSIGGAVVHPHPKILMCSSEPLDYYIGENTYLETLYETYDSVTSFRNYDLWCQILALGKHVYASGGSDTHSTVKNCNVSVFYSAERSGSAFFEIMRRGDFAVGAVGVKMAIDEYPMGSETIYRDGMILRLRIGDFYKHELHPDHSYRVSIITDRGVAYSSVYDGVLPQTIGLEVKDRKFYRVEIFDLSGGYRVSVGNPIWLDGKADE